MPVLLNEHESCEKRIMAFMRLNTECIGMMNECILSRMAHMPNEKERRVFMVRKIFIKLMKLYIEPTEFMNYVIIVLAESEMFIIK